MTKKEARAGSLEAVVLFATTIGATEKAGRWFWHKNESSGWINAKQPIKNWRSCFIAWWEADYFPRNCYPAPIAKEPEHKCIWCSAPWVADGIGGWKYQCKCYQDNILGKEPF